MRSGFSFLRVDETECVVDTRQRPVVSLELREVRSKCAGEATVSSDARSRFFISAAYDGSSFCRPTAGRSVLRPKSSKIARMALAPMSRPIQVGYKAAEPR